MDPIAFELFKNSIFSIADEMALTVFRTTYSGVLKDNMDYSTGFADAEGKLVAQGLTLPGHLGSVPTAMDRVHHRLRIALGGGSNGARQQDRTRFTGSGPADKLPVQVSSATPGLTRASTRRGASATDADCASKASAQRCCCQ